GENAFQVLADVEQFAHAHNVKLIVWKDSQDFVTSPGVFDLNAMQTFMTAIKNAGVAGAKVDFLRVAGNTLGESHSVLNYMAATYQYAAGLQLLVDFHGAPKDTGANVSFPNALTTEDLRGLESGATASHDATLPFTTLLAGPADYTPGVFSSDANP